MKPKLLLKSQHFKESLLWTHLSTFELCSFIVGELFSSKCVKVVKKFFKCSDTACQLTLRTLNKDIHNYTTRAGLGKRLVKSKISHKREFC